MTVHIGLINKGRRAKTGLALHFLKGWLTSEARPNTSILLCENLGLKTPMEETKLAAITEEQPRLPKKV